MNLTDLMQATQAARTATKMPIGTRAKAGKLQVVLVTYSGKDTVVDPLSGWVALQDAVQTLRDIARDGGFHAAA